MASQVYCNVWGSKGGSEFALSCTETAWGELLDAVSGLSIGEVMAGKDIKGFSGQYAAGTGLVRLRNTQTNQVKFMGLLNITNAYVTQYLRQPVVVDQFDVLEAMTQAVA